MHSTVFLIVVVLLLTVSRCIKRESSNDGSHLIYGSVSVITALDAVTLDVLQMMLIVDMMHNVVLYTGVQKVSIFIT